MGFFNREVRGPLDKMFDFDGDGKLHAFEQALQLQFLEKGYKEAMSDDDLNVSLEFDDLDEMDEDLDSDDFGF